MIVEIWEVGAGYDCHSVMFMHGHEVCFKVGLGWVSNIW